MGLTGSIGFKLQVSCMRGEVAGQAAEHAQLALAEVLAQLRASAGWRGQA